MNTENSIPEKLPAFMRCLIKKAQQLSFMELIARWDVDEADYLEIEAWFKKFGIDL